MNNRNISSDLDQLFQFVKSKKPLSKDDVLACQNIIRTIQSQDSGILNTLNYDERKFTLLMYSAKNQHREILNTLLDAKADPNIQNEDGMTALIICARCGHDNAMIAKDLIDTGANMDLAESGAPGGTALMSASEFNNPKIANLLIEEKANMNFSYHGSWTALSRALGRGNKEIILRLLNANVKIDFEYRHHQLKIERYLQALKKYNRYCSIDKSFTLDEFLSNPKLPPPNRSALLEDRLSTIILKKKKDKSNQDIIELQQCLMEIKECKDTPKPDINEALILAVYHRSIPFVIELLKAGADINYVDKWGRTALRGSAYDKNMFALLLEHGADMHLNNSGNTCLIACCEDESRVKDAQLLIKNGVDINYIHDQLFSQLTPLGTSIRSKNEAVFDELLKAGVDINKEDAYGHTPLFWAIEGEQRVMIQKLIATNAGCLFSQDDLNHAKEVDSINSKSTDPQNSLYSFLTKLQETHPCHSAKSILINQLDEGIGNPNYPTVLLNLIASYDDRYNHNYFFRCKENIEKIEMKQELPLKPKSELGEKQSLMDDVPFKCTLY